MINKMIFQNCALNNAGAIGQNVEKIMFFSTDAKNAYGEELVQIAANVCAECRLATVCQPHIDQDKVVTEI